MHARMELRVYRDEIAIAVAAVVTHEAISITLQCRHPSQHGFSSRSVRWFCSWEGIHYSSVLFDQRLDRVLNMQCEEMGIHTGGEPCLDCCDPEELLLERIGLLVP